VIFVASNIGLSCAREHEKKKRTDLDFLLHCRPGKLLLLSGHCISFAPSGSLHERKSHAQLHWEQGIHWPAANIPLHSLTTTTTTTHPASLSCELRIPLGATPAKQPLYHEPAPRHHCLPLRSVRSPRVTSCHRSAIFTPPRNISARFAWPLALWIESPANHSTASLRLDCDRPFTIDCGYA
jgi:hypothetical protein